jgi:hypothetical protein
MRWSIRLQEYSFDIVHRSGKQNANADALSREPLPLDKARGLSAIDDMDARMFAATGWLAGEAKADSKAEHKLPGEPAEEELTGTTVDARRERWLSVIRDEMQAVTLPTAEEIVAAQSRDSRLGPLLRYLTDGTVAGDTVEAKGRESARLEKIRPYFVVRDGVLMYVTGLRSAAQGQKPEAIGVRVAVPRDPISSTE